MRKQDGEQTLDTMVYQLQQCLISKVPYQWVFQAWMLSTPPRHLHSFREWVFSSTQGPIPIGSVLRLSCPKRGKCSDFDQLGCFTEISLICLVFLLSAFLFLAVTTSGQKTTYKQLLTFTAAFPMHVLSSAFSPYLSFIGMYCPSHRQPFLLTFPPWINMDLFICVFSIISRKSIFNKYSSVYFQAAAQTKMFAILLIP